MKIFHGDYNTSIMREEINIIIINLYATGNFNMYKKFIKDIK